MNHVLSLTRGFVAIVDDDGFKKAGSFKWHTLTSSGGTKTYAARKIRRSDGTRTALLLHRFLMDAPDDMEVDHENLDGLDCRYSNMRLATHAENGRNRGKNRNNTSGFKGVSWDKEFSKWIATITVDGKRIYLGRFADKRVARDIYNEASIRLHTDFNGVHHAA